MELRPHLAPQARQTITMTPQVIQSIKMLKFGNDELTEFLREQEERNPLIEVVARAPEEASGRPERRDASAVPSRDSGRGVAPGVGGGARGEEMRSLEETCAATLTLRECLLQQAELSLRDPAERVVAGEIVESIEPDGYLRRDLDEIADHLDLDVARVAAVLLKVQGFEPAGVGARDLAECLRLQLEDAGLVSEPMDRLLDNLGLVAGCDFDRLARICGVDRPALAGMIHTIRGLDPRPGLKYECSPLLPALPDLKLAMSTDGSFTLELNTELLPKVLVDREYYAEMRAGTSGRDDTRFVVDCMRNATWLARNLDQRANTILKVATEIVKRQRDFFLHGAAHIKPLSQSDVAEAVGMHPSTICRATANKYVLTDRGTFELKYFFSNAIASEGEEEVSAEAIRARIRDLIGSETAGTVLSDDALAKVLQGEGVDIARRTVAKYREMMGIPSSQLRKRQQRAAELEQEYCAA